ncbi:ATP-binding cassette domain-containing protein [Microbacterium oxydans]|uniref:ATP-binding cassette domain-containing protein n=1 Tax=Microbacterium TaxID=33882 RepID=UPI00187D2161|nr:ATP-binding cassette domain-containing protein [Microbacterium sp. R1]MBE7953062.1 ATP-binding cassette domain-containing protein [Microbacterium sp. R1]
MPEGQVLEFTHVTKRFNEVTAVSDFSARVEPGAVTAFLGPNGAGKTTTLRILLGQVRATSGTATIGGTAYAELRQPLRTIGSVLEETVYRPRRTAERQLTIAAKANGIPLARVGEVLSLVGLEGEGGSRIGGFSLGMRQRLSVAHALLGDPGALVFDEPANGLDPEGIRWMRLLMRRLADEGRTVLVSSHVLSEVEQVADNVLVLSKGTLVLSSGIETLADPKGGSVIVDAADRSSLTTALQEAGFDIEVLRSGLTVRGGDAGTVGAVAADAGIALSTLVQRGPTLEDVFIDLMRGGRFAPSISATPPQLAATAPEDTAAEVTAAEDIASEDTASEDTAAEVTAAETAVAGPAPADSVVAIPVAAAAAWAAEAAAAPAGEAPVDDLAASVDTGDRSEHTSDESDVPSSDASASTDEAPAAEHDAEHAQAEQAPSEESPERSFDEILFGSAAPAEAAGDQAADPANGNEHHSGVEVFADLHDAPESTHTDESDDQLGAGPTDDDALVSTSDESESESDSDSSDDVAAVTADDEDPRSAAVSSMLAAAARAYYEDEPRDYPLSAENQTAEEQHGEGGVSDEGAHWTVASTGVIDTVPLAASTDSGEAGDTAASEAEEPGAEESPTEESPTEESLPDGFGADEHGTEQSGTADAGAGEQSEPDDEHRHDEHRHDEHGHDEHGRN